MILKDKLKKLRTERGLTQEETAEKLGVSSQTVSKWERGLRAPDIELLPKIAILYRCSIDSIFDMESSWNTEHENEFKKKMAELYEKRDFEGVWNAWITEIELKPDDFGKYTAVMDFALKFKMFDDNRIKRLLLLSDYAKNYCRDDDIRNEIHRLMLQICAGSENPKIKEMAKEFHSKLPSYRHSREVYAKFVMDDKAYREQTKENILYMTDVAECAVRQLLKPEMTPAEKVFYYKKAAALYETVLDGKYGGVYDVPLIFDYGNIATFLMAQGNEYEAEEYISKIIGVLEKHLNTNNREHSRLLHNPEYEQAPIKEQSIKKILLDLQKIPLLKKFRPLLKEVYIKYQNIPHR
ncbi:MAG: helix-turn-helix transcriptional regulator [Clostridia bacterium]|nr:helix-turn-helix transcriptional regulator [Clostridia bacterium]